MTLSRNTPQVKRLKLKLVKSFSEAKKSIIANQIKTPQTYIEALEVLIASEKQKELLKIQNVQLEQENELLAEAVDGLFNYSSIIRVAKFNNISEKHFNWRQLKATSILMDIEIKKVPSPRFEYQNLYSHDVWRVAYPEVMLPETTTLTIINN
jgi:hypothetical protein